MKKIITIFCCIYGSALFSQNTSSILATEEAPNWSFMLANLPNNQISSGVLLDKIVDFADITNFNTVEKNLSDNKHFTQVLSELYKASDQTKFISTTTLNTRTAYSTNENSVDIGIINTLFHRLNFNEDNASLTGVNYNGNQFSVVAGKPTFISKKVLIASPLKEMVSGSSINFNFNDTFVFNNATTTIKTLTVKFDDSNNTPVNIINNGAFVINTKNITYTTSGFKTLEFNATFSDNTTITTYGKINVNITDRNAVYGVSGTNDLCSETLRERGIYPSTTADIANTVAFQGYDETYSFKGKIEYTVFYSNNNSAKKMLKPIIIVDGFDPKDKRKVQDCDCENDPTCKMENSDIIISWTGLIPHIQFVFNPTKHISIEDSMIYSISSTQNVNFMSELRSLGYDVIIVNQPTYQIVDPVTPTIQVWVPTTMFPFVAGHYETRPNIRTIDGGADYIERNALTLVSFIQSIKSKQTSVGSTEGLVLIGPSMGGQITRYALAYMEKKFSETGNAIWKHNARLWVSVDSPHLGANIPVGAQANIWFMADKLGKEEAQKSYDELNSVAGKQQSITNFEYARTSSNHNLQGSPFFTAYYNNLNSNGVSGSNGYPVSTPSFRKIAMINGSLAGTKQGTEGQTFLFTKVFIRGVWPFQSSTITLARFKDSFMSGYGSTGQIFQGDGQNFNIGLNHWTINHPRYTLNVNNQDIRGSLDVVPGGYFKIGKILKTSIEGGASSSGYRSETADYIENNSFISAYSSLGHLNPLQNWSNPLNTNLVCASNKQTPFDSYWGSDINTEHTSFTRESVEWLKKELEGNPQLLHFPIQENALQGPSSLCENSNANYTFGDICKIPSEATWTVTGNLELVNSTPLSLIVKGTGNGIGVITATFQNGQVFQKEIWVGAPAFKNFDFTNNMGASNCLAPTDPLKMDLPTDKVIANFDGMSNLEIFNNNNWQWQVNNNMIMLNSPNDKNTRTICPMFTGLTSFKVRAKNQCGWSEWYEIPEFEITRLNTNWFSKQSSNIFIIYPNPSDDIVNIILKDIDRKDNIVNEINAELFDIIGSSKIKFKIINNNATFSVKGLNKGIYTLKIYLNNEIETHQISVK